MKFIKSFSNHYWDTMKSQKAEISAVQYRWNIKPYRPRLKKDRKILTINIQKKNTENFILHINSYIKEFIKLVVYNTCPPNTSKLLE